MADPKNSKDSMIMAYGLYSAVGIQLVLSVVAGFYAGNWVDTKLGTAPWLMLLGILLGAIAGFYNLVRILNRNKQ